MTQESQPQDNAPPPPPVEPASAPPPKKSKDLVVKLVFLAVILVILGVVTYMQLRGNKLDWLSDFAAAQAQAKKQNERLVVFIHSFPATQTDNDMTKEGSPLNKERNRQAMADCVKCEVRLDRSAGWARRYGLQDAKTTPVMLVISPDGKKFYRQDGFIGETDFRDKFMAHPLDQTAKD
jgi:hypothetical protein